MSNAFLTPVGAEIAMPERRTVASHPAGWLVSSPVRRLPYHSGFSQRHMVFRAERESGCLRRTNRSDRRWVMRFCTRAGQLGLSRGAGQDGCAVYWVEPVSLNNPVVYNEEVVLDLGRSDVLLTMSQRERRPAPSSVGWLITVCVDSFRRHRPQHR